MKKRLLSVVLSLLLMATLMPSIAFADESLTETESDKVTALDNSEGIDINEENGTGEEADTDYESRDDFSENTDNASDEEGATVGNSAPLDAQKKGLSKEGAGLGNEIIEESPAENLNDGADNGTNGNTSLTGESSIELIFNNQRLFTFKYSKDLQQKLIINYKIDEYYDPFDDTHYYDPPNSLDEVRIDFYEIIEDSKEWDWGLTPDFRDLGNVVYSLDIGYKNDKRIEVIPENESTGFIDGKQYAVFIETTDGGIDIWGDVSLKLPADSITLKDSHVNMTVGQTHKTSYTIEPAGSYGDVQWKTSDSSVATVSNKGVITAKSAGSCDISAVTSMGHEAVCSVTVTPKLNITSKTLKGGQSFQCTLKGAASGVTWSTSNDNVARVGADGKVTARYPGACTITASYGGKAYKCKVTVTANIKCKAKTIWGGKSFTNAINGSISKVKWKSSNTRIATVNSKGVVKGKYPGTCTITGNYNGKQYTCKVTVKAKLKYKSKSIWGRKTFKNSITGSVSKIKWTSSNKKIATVNAKGVVKGVKPGKCIISAKYGGKVYKCKVTVKTALNYNYVELYKREKFRLKLLGATGSIKWKSSNSSVVSVSSKGMLRGKKAGTATVTAKCRGKTYKCKVKVLTRWPNFGAVLYDYNTRDNYFVVKFRNLGPKNIKITSGVKVEDVDYKSFDRYVHLKKAVTIPPKTTKFVRFYVDGRTTWSNYSDFTLIYKFRFDDLRWEGHVWDSDSVFKRSKKWYKTYWRDSEDWYQEWYWY